MADDLDLEATNNVSGSATPVSPAEGSARAAPAERKSTPQSNWVIFYMRLIEMERLVEERTAQRAAKIAAEEVDSAQAGGNAADQL